MSLISVRSNAAYRCYREAHRRCSSLAILMLVTLHCSIPHPGSSVTAVDSGCRSACVTATCSSASSAVAAWPRSISPAISGTHLPVAPEGSFQLRRGGRAGDRLRDRPWPCRHGRARARARSGHAALRPIASRLPSRNCLDGNTAMWGDRAWIANDERLLSVSITPIRRITPYRNE